MFGMKNTSFNVKLVKDTPTLEYAPIGSEPSTIINTKELGEAATEFVTRTAVTIGVVYSGVKVLNTLCDIAKIAAKAKF